MKSARSRQANSEHFHGGQNRGGRGGGSLDGEACSHPGSPAFSIELRELREARSATTPLATASMDVTMALIGSVGGDSKGEVGCHGVSGAWGRSRRAMTLPL